MRAAAVRRRLVATLVFSLGLGLPLAGCGQAPDYTGDPAGVDRNARPQVIVKKQEVYLDGQLIRLGTTTGAEVSRITGHDARQKGSDEYWDKTGITIHSSEFDERPGRPVLAHRVMIWLRRVSDIPASKEIERPCTAEEHRRHEGSQADRLREVTEEEAQRGWNLEEVKERIRSEICFKFVARPLHAFSGYLEVDGLPLTANMSLAEIQARRKRLGLLPLYNRTVGGPLMYNAPLRPNELAFNQVWEFEYVPKEGASLDEQKLLKRVRIP